MKVDYVSDLHIDNWVNQNKNFNKWHQDVEQFITQFVDCNDEHDVLIIAGDISHYNHISECVVKVFAQYYNKIYVVFGNHDYYLISNNQKSIYETSSNRIKQLANKLNQIENVVCFDNKKVTYDIYCDKIFSGCSLVSLPKTEEEISFYKLYMNDYNYIIDNLTLLHEQQLQIYNQLSKMNCDVFISHYPIITTNSHLKYHKHSWASYKCDVNQLIAQNYVFGHVHEQDIYDVLDSKFYINALGYPHEGLEHKIQTFYI